MKKLIGMAAAGALLMTSAAPAGAEDVLNITAGASASFAYDFNDPDVLSDGAPALVARNQQLYSSFEQDESFNIDLLQLAISGERGIVGFAAKIDLGDLASQAGDDLDGDIGLQEVNLLIQAIDTDMFDAAVRAGRFGTQIGYELLEPWANANISRSRAWMWQPINHDGVVVESLIGEGEFATGLSAGIVNSFFVADQAQVTGSLADVRRANNRDDEYGAIAQIKQGLGNALSLSIAGIYSEELDSAVSPGDGADVFEINGILGGNCGNCRYALESTYRKDNPDRSSSLSEVEVIDVTGYAGFSFGRCSIDARLGWTNEDYDEDETWLLNATVTGGVWITDGVQLRAEYRYDYADDPDGGLGFYDDDNESPNESDIHVIQAQVVWNPTIGS